MKQTVCDVCGEPLTKYTKQGSSICFLSFYNFKEVNLLTFPYIHKFYDELDVCRKCFNEFKGFVEERKFLNNAKSTII